MNKFKLCIKTPFSLPTGSIQDIELKFNTIYENNLILFSSYGTVISKPLLALLIGSKNATK